MRTREILAAGLLLGCWSATAPAQPTREGFDPDGAKWELYHVDEDFSQATDLAAQNPDKLRQLQDLWWVEASKYNVLPLDWRGTQRMNAEAMGRPTLGGDAKTLAFYPGQAALPDADSPRLLNKSRTITTDVDVPEAAEGVVGGYALYLKGGGPAFVYNDLALDRPTFAAKDPLPKGKARLVVDFAYDGKPGEFGKGGKLTLSAGGKVVAEGRLEKTIPVQFGLGEDAGSAVDFSYPLPFKFNGAIEKVIFELK